MCEGTQCTINSVAPLPFDIHEIMLELDRKYRAGEYRRAEDPDWVRAPEEIGLTENQKRGLRFVDGFHGANPL